VSDPGILKRKKRLGRPPKENKRLPLNLRVRADLRARLLALAEANGLSITEQVERLVEHAMNEDPSRSAYPSADKQSPVEDEFEKWKSLLYGYGRYITGISLMLCNAMGVAALQSNAWSRDAVKRTRRFGRKQPGASSSLAEIEKLQEFLENTASTEWGCFDDPFVFGQLVEATRYVLEKMAPEGDPSAVPSPPRGIDPVLAVLLMRDFGRNAGDLVIRNLVDDKEELSPFVFYIRACLGDDVLARLKGRIAIDPWQPDPT
jgi:hypothetical protein